MTDFPKLEDSLLELNQQVALKRKFTLTQSVGAGYQVWKHGSGPLDEGRVQHLNSKGGNALEAKFIPDDLAVSSALVNSRLAFWSSAK